jgi:LmbE family N-acetylglucosaminyl deacetylase
MARATGSQRPRRRLPRWDTVLAVVAHPDDESFGLGAVLAAFVDAGTRAAVLCLTHGEASTLHGAAGDLYRVRARELAVAATTLGAGPVELRHYPDGGLASASRTLLAGEVVDSAHNTHADGLLVFDRSGVTGHPDHIAATAAALAAADVLDLPVLGWALPAHVADTLNVEGGTAFEGHTLDQIDYIIQVDRDRQRAALAEHASQAVSSSVLWRRLELLGNTEHLRWLRAPHTPGSTDPSGAVGPHP